MKPHIHTDRIEVLRREIEQEILYVEAFTRENKEDLEVMMRSDTPMSACNALTERMRFRNRAIKTGKNRIERLQKERELLEKSGGGGRFDS